MAMIRAFMVHGHLEADTDPLNLDKSFADSSSAVADSYARPGSDMRKLVDYKFYGFTEADLDR